MLSVADFNKRRRQIYVVVTVFLFLSAFLCVGSYLGWFGWWMWGRPKPPPKDVVAEGKEASEFAKRLMATEARFARADVKELRVMLGKMNLVKDARYRKYAEEFSGKLKRKPDPLTILSVANPTAEESVAKTSDLEKQDLLRLYETATLVERRLHHVYRMFRTCELARIQHVPLGEAYEATNVVVPQHPKVDKSVFVTEITTTASEAAKRLKNEISMIKVEIKAMVGAGNRMLDMAAILEPELLGYGSEWEFANAEGQMFNTTALIGAPPKMFDGQTGTEPNAFQHEWGRGEGPITKKDLGLPVELGIDLSQSMPLPGRKLLAHGMQKDWMFINTWYVIGPFPNPNRRNLEKKFPPETALDPRLGFVGIDLDASYVGMNNKPIRWNFRATDRMVCFVPTKPADWAIWYAYTEIWSEKEQDKFCIFGSDDYGKCWVNGEEVFTSGVTPHPWVPDRKYAKVHFRRGFNVVLFKLENAWGRTGWSLCVYTGELASDA